MGDKLICLIQAGLPTFVLYLSNPFILLKNIVMKKIYAFSFMLFFSTLFIFAKDVDLSYATQVAKNFYLQNTHSNETEVSLHLIYSCKTNDHVGRTSDGKPVYYIFDADGNKGFVIVSGDDLVEPVLGYSTTGRFTIDNLAPATQKWMKNYEQQIVFVKENVTETTPAITAKWQNYYNNVQLQSGSRATNAVSPLCATTWNQNPFENEMCPLDNGQHAVTGCVATAMAQIMKFWNYPTQGVGNHSYNEPHFGSLSANFGNTTYNWGAMPNNLTSSNSAVALLMSHCGISVDMNYSTQGSYAWVVASNSPVCAQNSYKDYFGYDPATIQGLDRPNYSDQQWISMIKGELDANRPLQYAGAGGGGGHTWVCDGYDANDFFHMNWGWGGNSDGNFSLANLDPSSLGTGGGSGGFNSQQQIVIGIKPLGGGGGGGTINQGGMVLHAATTVSANPFVTGNSFSVNAEIANTGTASFSGYLAAGIFNSNGVFQSFVQELSGQSLQNGFYNTFTFTTGALQLIPGVYSIGIYYQNGSNQYSLVDAGAFYNPVTFTVTGAYSDIQMAGNTTVTPSTIVKGQPFNIATAIGNAGLSSATGWLDASLYDLDGNFVVDIKENQGTLAAQTSYNVQFSSTGLNVAPGTYYIAFFSTPDQNNYSLVYTTSYPNPVLVNIVEAALSPDVYENNNTEGAPAVLPVNFSGNNATVNTAGSNMHIGTDYDYYQINLPGGTNYAITASLLDKYNAGGGNYSNDAVFSYSVNGGGWSSVYDDVMPGPITVIGGGNVKFFLADYFQGSVGTYQFNMDIARGNNLGVNDISANKIHVFPNPAKEEVFVDAGDANGDYTLSLYNKLGEVVKDMNGSFSNSLVKVSLSALPAGIYQLQLKTDKGLATSKIVVQ